MTKKPVGNIVYKTFGNQ